MWGKGEMARILFVPTESREIAQFSLVKPELEAIGHEITAIALDRGRALDKSREPLETLLRQNGFTYRPVTDYHTYNMLKIIQEEAPDIVVTDWSGFTPNALIYAANHVGIPCLQINDGITSDYFAVRKRPAPGKSVLRLMKRALRLLVFKANPRPLLYLVVTLAALRSPRQLVRKMAVEMLKSTYPISSYTEGLNIAVISPYARDAHLRMGAPEKNVFITGQPRFDLIQRVKTNGREVLEKLNIPAGKGVVVLATQPLHSLWTEEERKEFLETIIEGLEQLPEKQLVIKLHPAEEEEDYRALLGKTGWQVVLCRDIDLYALLRACELLITVHSTVALEAMILGKPVITVNLTGRPDVMPYAASGAALGVYRPEDLVPAMTRALSDPETRSELARNRKKFVYEHAYKLDGRATKRVAGLIEWLIEESKSQRQEGARR